MNFNTNLVLGRSLAAPLREIHEIEFSSRCNLACKYCPHPKMRRPKADMTDETFDRTMLHLQYLCDAGTQGEVSLTGIGEAFLHENFVPWLRVVRGIIGHRRLVLSTNGLLMTPALATELAANHVVVFVSSHRPEKAGPAIQMLIAAGCSQAINNSFMDAAFDWAGQVKWYVSARVHRCAYLGDKWGAVRQDGSVNTCCMDAESLYPVGSVYDEVGSLKIFATELCVGCNMVAPEEFREARKYPEELVAYLYARAKAEEAA